MSISCIHIHVCKLLHCMVCTRLHVAWQLRRLCSACRLCLSMQRLLHHRSADLSAVEPALLATPPRQLCHHCLSSVSTVPRRAGICCACQCHARRAAGKLCLAYMCCSGSRACASTGEHHGMALSTQACKSKQRVVRIHRACSGCCIAFGELCRERRCAYRAMQLQCQRSTTARQAWQLLFRGIAWSA